MRDESDTTQRTCVNVNMLSYPTKNIRNVTKIMECQSVCQKCERYSENANVLAFHKATDNSWQVWRIWNLGLIILHVLGFHEWDTITLWTQHSQNLAGRFQSLPFIHSHHSWNLPPSLSSTTATHRQTDNVAGGTKEGKKSGFLRAAAAATATAELGIITGWPDVHNIITKRPLGNPEDS